MNRFKSERTFFIQRLPSEVGGCNEGRNFGRPKLIFPSKSLIFSVVNVVSLFWQVGSYFGLHSSSTIGTLTCIQDRPSELQSASKVNHPKLKVHRTSTTRTSKCIQHRPRSTIRTTQYIEVRSSELLKSSKFRQKSDRRPGIPPSVCP